MIKEVWNCNHTFKTGITGQPLEILGYACPCSVYLP